jgi:hypothetical protein
VRKLQVPTRLAAVVAVAENVVEAVEQQTPQHHSSRAIISVRVVVTVVLGVIRVVDSLSNVAPKPPTRSLVDESHVLLRRSGMIVLCH